MRYLVTGGAGFIGSNFIRFLFNKYGEDAEVVNLDKWVRDFLGRNRFELRILFPGQTQTFWEKAITVAPATTWPFGSVTVPRSVPVCC